MKIEELTPQVLAVESIEQAKMAIEAFLSLCDGFSEDTRQLQLDYAKLIRAAVADGIPAEFEANRIMRVVGNAAADGVRLLMHVEATMPNPDPTTLRGVASAWLRRRGVIPYPFTWRGNNTTAELVPVEVHDDRVVELIDLAPDDNERARLATLYPFHVQLHGLLGSHPGAIEYLRQLAAGHDPTQDWKG